MLTLLWVWSLAAALVWIAWSAVRAEPAADPGTRPSRGARADGEEGDDGPPVALMGPGRRPRLRGQGRAPTPLDKEQAAKLLFGRRKTFAVVWRWLERMGIPVRDRGDAAQDALAAAWSSWHTYDPTRGRPERWLNTITMHVASHYLAAVWRKREELVADPLDPEAADPSPDPFASMDIEQARLAVLDALQAIDVDLRSVLIAHDIDEIPMTEIAEQSGVSLSAAYNCRRRALRAFAHEMKRRERK